MQVILIAGTDGMLLNLSGAHGPFFTRNLVLLTDSAGCTGVGEVPGGEKIRQALEDARLGAGSTDWGLDQYLEPDAGALRGSRQQRPRQPDF